MKKVGIKKIEDSNVIAELHDLWNSRHKSNPSYMKAKNFTKRLINVA